MTGSAVSARPGLQGRCSGRACRRRRWGDGRRIRRSCSRRGGSRRPHRSRARRCWRRSGTGPGHRRSSCGDHAFRCVDDLAVARARDDADGSLRFGDPVAGDRSPDGGSRQVPLVDHALRVDDVEVADLVEERRVVVRALKPVLGQILQLAHTVEVVHTAEGGAVRDVQQAAPGVGRPVVPGAIARVEPCVGEDRFGGGQVDGGRVRDPGVCGLAGEGVDLDRLRGVLSDRGVAVRVARPLRRGRSVDAPGALRLAVALLDASGGCGRFFDCASRRGQGGGGDRDRRAPRWPAPWLGTYTVCAGVWGA